MIRTIEGSIDDQKRPLIRLDLQILNAVRASVRLASQRREAFLLGWGKLPWFGERKAIAAHIPVETRQEGSARIARNIEDEILIGTELLSECHLEIDFPGRRVRVSKAG